MYYYYDATYSLVIIGALIVLAAQAKVKMTYGRYKNVRNARGFTGRDAAERILHYAGIRDVQVRHIGGQMTDYYDPVRRQVCLSDSTYASASVAALGIAAHECGHAIQHQKGYAFLTFRSSLVPVVQFTSQICWPLILIGFLFNGRSSTLLLTLGAALFSLSVLFQIVTLPVEFNASARALSLLDALHMMDDTELRGTKKVLRAAALTYVAGCAQAVLQLLRILLIIGTRGGNRRGD